MLDYGHCPMCGIGHRIEGPLNCKYQGKNAFKNLYSCGRIFIFWRVKGSYAKAIEGECASKIKSSSE